METKRLAILKNSLAKKESEFDKKLDAHYTDVKSANGQPLNDKRNGQSTLNRWDKQNDSLRKLNESIEKTKKAIENEEYKIADVKQAKSSLPNDILKLVESGELLQWRNHPNTFFVKGVDKARIVWDNKKSVVCHKYLSHIVDEAQRKHFAQIYNSLYLSLNQNK